MSYWKFRWPNWDSLSAKKQEEKKQEVLKEFIDFVTGTDNAGMAFISEYNDDPDFKDKYPGWEIETLEGDFKGGEYVEDSREADFIITRAFNVSGQLIQSPLKGQSSGSGSDIRVALNQAIMMEKPTNSQIPFSK